MEIIRSFRRKSNPLNGDSIITAQLKKKATVRELLYKVTIPERVRIKKNSKQLVRRGAKVIPISSKLYRNWELQAMLHVKQSHKAQPIDGLLEVNYRFYFKNHSGEADTSNCVEGPADLLQKAGVIRDDKQIIKFTAQKFFGEEPRTEIEIYRFIEPTEGVTDVEA